MDPFSGGRSVTSANPIERFYSCIGELEDSLRPHFRIDLRGKIEREYLRKRAPLL